ncbi:PREDICTED: uncharacterized protein LOC107164119 [Diuraphis noxia]|uniref:uncharacterized protein LOC107164119 n=1 Tax=Diuraphis noxia TaxID=143948 RepID=UPI00076368A4|nr:PREDICTED: uncharacterized protein LOC107164119 [Diuraphis noxia]
MVYFTEKLINEIRKRSCIWDTADVNHLNKEMLTNMWTEIAGNLYSDWHTLGVFDKRDRVSDVKKKWTNIKDSFVKDVKGNKPKKTLRLPEHRKKYYLFDHLQFLMPFIQDTKSGGGVRPAEDGAGLSVSKKMRKNTLLGEGSSRNAPSMVVAPSETAAKRPETLQPDVQQHADLLNNFAGKAATNALCQLDGDLSFIVSLLPTIKSMNEKQKINFKIGVLQLMSQIKFDEVENNPHTATTNEQLNAAITNHILPRPRQLHQVSNVRNPRVNVAVSSTQQLQHNHNQKLDVEHGSPQVKQEVVDLSPGSSSWCYDNDTSTEEDVEYTLDRNNYKPS